MGAIYWGAAAMVAGIAGLIIGDLTREILWAVAAYMGMFIFCGLACVIGRRINGSA